MDRQTVELSAIGFQALVTVCLGVVYFALWRQQRRPHFGVWAAAWACYAARLAFISSFIVRRDEVFLFAHQVATGFTALLLLLAALQFSRGLRWRPAYLAFGLLPVAWAGVALGLIHSPVVAGASSVVILSAVTLWTGWVFARHAREAKSGAASALAWTFSLWGLHHLDYPLLRPLGTGVLFGVFADVIFIVAASVGTLFLVLSAGRRELEVRSRQLEELSRLLLTAQEDERRRIARELHDEAGQVLTAIKIELDLDGRSEAAAMVGRALTQIRDLSNLLRPSVLDDLGLVPAVRGLVEDFARRTRLEAVLETPETLPALDSAAQVAVYRVVQEALTNVARHADARHVWVRLAPSGAGVRLTVRDDGRGTDGKPLPHLGLLGIRERVTGLGGTLEIAAAEGEGFCMEAMFPVGDRV